MRPHEILRDFCHIACLNYSIKSHETFLKSLQAYDESCNQLNQVRLYRISENFIRWNFPKSPSKFIKDFLKSAKSLNLLKSCEASAE